uniref:Uncharacterized protein n=1 Tax=Anguilla anguilla TaxID=7936 RepID=A0A0E9UMT8_ANGAN
MSYEFTIWFGDRNKDLTRSLGLLDLCPTYCKTSQIYCFISLNRILE